MSNPKFNRNDRVTIDGGLTVYTVLHEHEYGKDVLVAKDPERDAGVWVSIEQVAHVQKENRP